MDLDYTLDRPVDGLLAQGGKGPGTHGFLVSLVWPTTVLGQSF